MITFTINNAFKLEKFFIASDKSLVYSKYFINFESLSKFLKEEEKFSSGDIEYIDMEGRLAWDRGNSTYEYNIEKIQIQGEI